MAGLQIIARDRKGNIKQDYEISSTSNGRTVKIDEMKKAQEKGGKKDGRRSIK